jgi:hypothetical protein
MGGKSVSRVGNEPPDRLKEDNGIALTLDDHLLHIVIFTRQKMEDINGPAARMRRFSARRNDRL